MNRTQFLIVGAGPYSIATAAYANHLGIDAIVVGRPLDFWKANMPRGMFLRSGPDWHLDPLDVATFEAYLRQRQLNGAEIKPVPRDTFLDYARWFMDQYGVIPRSALVTDLTRNGGNAPHGYTATLEDGSQVHAESVLLGLGYTFFKYCPPDVVEKMPPGSYVHTCDAADLACYRDKRILIVGGRQSAFEWAALLNEQGAERVDLTYRHATPRFTEPDWSWVQPMVRRTLEDRGWWRQLSPDQQERIRHDFWSQGRLILEEWLDARVHQPDIHLHEKTTVVTVKALADDTHDVLLDDGNRMNVHHIILATGYRPNMQNVAFLDRATIRQPLATVEGCPVLDTEFQTNLPNLYVTGLAATRDFGPFFGFTVGCPVSARIIGDAVASRTANVQIS